MPSSARRESETNREPRIDRHDVAGRGADRAQQGHAVELLAHEHAHARRHADAPEHEGRETDEARIAGQRTELLRHVLLIALHGLEPDLRFVERARALRARARRPRRAASNTEMVSTRLPSTTRPVASRSLFSHEDPGRDLRLQTEAARRFLDRRRDLEVLARRGEAIPDARCRAGAATSSRRRPGPVGFELAPVMRRLRSRPRRRSDTPRRSRADRRADCAPSAPPAPSSPSRVTRVGGCGRRGFERFERRRSSGPKGSRLSSRRSAPSSSFERRSTALVDRLAQGVEAHDHGDPDRHAAAVEAEAPRRRAQLAPHHAEHEARLHPVSFGALSRALPGVRPGVARSRCGRPDRRRDG